MLYIPIMEMLAYFHSVPFTARQCSYMICCLLIKKIRIDYREGYIDTSWHHIFGDFSRCVSKYTEWSIVHKTVNTAISYLMVCDLPLNADLFLPWTRISIAESSCHVRTPRLYMSIFLLKSDGAAPPNICFNVFVILVCSIYGENNIWHVKTWRFTLTVEVVFQTALHHVGSLVVSSFEVNLCKIGKVRRPQNPLYPFTANDTAWWLANCPANWKDLYARSQLQCGTD